MNIGCLAFTEFFLLTYVTDQEHTFMGLFGLPRNSTRWSDWLRLRCCQKLLDDKVLEIIGAGWGAGAMRGLWCPCGSSSRRILVRIFRVPRYLRHQRRKWRRPEKTGPSRRTYLVYLHSRYVKYLASCTSSSRDTWKVTATSSSLSFYWPSPCFCFRIHCCYISEVFHVLL